MMKALWTKQGVGFATPEETRKMIGLERQRCLRNGDAFSLVIFDVADGHKKDTHARKELARALRNRVRAVDECGWLYSESVCALLPSTSVEGAQRVAEDVRSRMERNQIATDYSIYGYSRRNGVDSETSEGLGQFGPEDLMPPEPIWKRPVDLALGLIGLVAVFPIMVLVALAIRVTSPGPIIFKQRRIGYRGRAFLMYKFRSMTNGCGDSVHRNYVNELIKGRTSNTSEGCYKLKDDPRVTAVGKFLREWSLDELPQLLNVVKGDMSLVGPRPDPWYAKGEYLPWYHERTLGVKPGITGLWQVEGRSRVSYENMVRMDIRYYKRLSIWNDLRIFFRTFGAVITRSGAH